MNEEKFINTLREQMSKSLSNQKTKRQRIDECTEEDHQDFHSLSEITRNDQSRMNEEVYEDRQERVTNEKKLSNRRRLNKVHSSM